MHLFWDDQITMWFGLYVIWIAKVVATTLQCLKSCTKKSADNPVEGDFPFVLCSGLWVSHLFAAANKAHTVGFYCQQ